MSRKSKINYVYVTKSINKDMTSHHVNNFKYPKSGIVEAHDWKANDECGGGLHGFLWGEGNGIFAAFNDTSVWLLIKVNPADGLIVMPDKCKFRRGEVVFVSDYKRVAAELQKYLPKDRTYKVIGGTASAGNHGAASAGDHGTASAGGGGSASAGEDGIIIIAYFDGENGKWRKKVGQIGADGLEPNVQYKLDSTFNFVKADGLEANIQYKLDSTFNFVKVE